jgi:hypothetical protein
MKAVGRRPKFDTTKYPDRRVEWLLGGDESGDFGSGPGPSPYFMLVTASAPRGTSVEPLGSGMDPVLDALEAQFRRLRPRENIGQPFHARTDRVEVRAALLEAIATTSVRLDATIVDKRRLGAAMRGEAATLYSSLVANHMWFVNTELHRPPVKLRVVLASLVPNSMQGAFLDGLLITQMAFEGPIHQMLIQQGEENLNKVPTSIWAMPSATEHRIIQVADACAWAIQRKWAGRSSTAYDTIAPNIHSERLVRIDNPPPWWPTHWPPRLPDPGGTTQSPETTLAAES